MNTSILPLWPISRTPTRLGLHLRARRGNVRRQEGCLGGRGLRGGCGGAVGGAADDRGLRGGCGRLREQRGAARARGRRRTGRGFASLTVTLPVGITAGRVMDRRCTMRWFSRAILSCSRCLLMAVLDIFGPACGAAVAAVPSRIASSLSRLTRWWFARSMAALSPLLCVWPPHPPWPLLTAGAALIDPGFDGRRCEVDCCKYSASLAARILFNCSFIWGAGRRRAAQRRRAGRR